MSLIELSTALVAAGGSVVVPFVNKAMEKTAARMGDTVDATLVALFTKAQHLLAATGREPQSIEPKLMVPLVNAARLEADDTLVDKWAALLANAVDSAQRIQVQPAFVEVLRQLTPTDALVLQKLYFPAGIQPGRSPAGSIMLQQLMALGSEKDQITVSVDNLLRLRLCVGGEVKSGIIPDDPARPVYILSTAFGTQFMLACTPPSA